MRQFLLILLLGLLAACGTQTRTNAPSETSPALTLSPERQLVVGYKDDANLQVIAGRLGARVVSTIPQLKAALLELPQGSSQNQAIRRLVGLARYAEANRFDRQPIPLPSPKATAQGVAAQAAFNDPLLSQQWWLGRIGAPNAWDQGGVGTGVTIGVVDTDFDRSHPDLCDQPARTRCVQGFNTFTLSPYAPTDPFQGVQTRDTHGSGSAGMAAALSNNGQFVAGVAGGSGDPASAAKLMPIAIFGGSNGGFSGDFNVAQGIVWATDHGANILNNSWGGGGYSYLLKDAFDYALLHGVVVVASAGNDNRDAFHLPSGYPGILAVAATNPHDEKADFSTYGPWVDLSAPGEDVLTTYINLGATKTWLFSGTSAASPLVAGAAAVVLQVLRDNGISPTPYQVMRILQMTADPVKGASSVTAGMGGGRVNLGKAVELAKSIISPTQLPEDGSDIQVMVLNKAASLSTDLSPYVPLSNVTLIHATTGKQLYAQTGFGNFTALPLALFVGSPAGQYRVQVGGPSQMLWGGSQDPQETVLDTAATPSVTLRQQADIYEITGGNTPARNNTLATATDLNALFPNLPNQFSLSAAIDSENFAQFGLPQGGYDEDFYRIQLKAGDTIRLETVASRLVPHSFADTYLRLYDSAGNLLAEDDDSAANSIGNVDSLISYTIPSDGSYYIEVLESNEVMNNGPRQGLNYHYRLEVTIKP